MSPQYKLAENQRFPKNVTPWNVYITASKVYFIPVDKQSPELKRLNTTYMAISVIGYRFGILGVLLVVGPLDAIMKPKMEAARARALERLRSISIADLQRLEGYSCLRSEVGFEEKRKGNYRVHLGKDWVLVDGPSARDLQRAMA
jgi:hypothetical protein